MVRSFLGKPAVFWWVVSRRLALDLVIVNLTALATAWIFAPTSAFAYGASHWLNVNLPLSLLAVLALTAARTYRVSARYASLADLPGVAFVGFVLAVGLAAVTIFVPAVAPNANAFSAPIVFWLLFCALWIAARWTLKIRQTPWLIARATNTPGARSVLIVGAGDAGDLVCRELGRVPGRRSNVIGFVDDDLAKQGSTLQGLPVLGLIEAIPALAKRLGIDEILVAIPSASGAEMRRISEICAKTKAVVRTLPSFEAMVAGRGNVLPFMREIQFEDLLRRKSVADDIKLENEYLRGETVLISGGGGSIGSELARQIVPRDPAGVIVLGVSENEVFEIDQELRHAGHTITSPVVCDIRDKAGLGRVFARYKPSIVFHAAAHKHVPLMEDVPIEAIVNNVFGTLTLAEESIKNGVKKLILVSTDKAVNPGNVMGATKRVAEMIVHALAKRSETEFSAVRFGNVLGSRGSLVPILQKQIRAGGPITITHPEMTRFFMTIPEAASLIVQAGAEQGVGQILILDMGDPVKIVDLAHDMVRLYGLVPGKDIEVRFIGIRPGEKMHEELAHMAETLQPCENPKISRVVSATYPEWDWLKGRLEELRQVCNEGDSVKARGLLLDIAWGKSMPPTAVVELDLDAAKADHLAE